MKLLLDTHAFLWFIAGNSSLSNDARVAIEDLNNEKFVSMASVWEIAIKVSIRKLSLSAPFETLIPQEISKNGFDFLDVKFIHIAELCTLPYHHRDPFDRLIIAQAIVEGIDVVSIDAAFDSYPVKRIW